MKDQSFVSVIFAHKALLRDAQSELNYLANAARTMGQDRLAAELEDIADRIVISGQRVIDANHDELSAQLSESQRAVGDTLMVLLGKAEGR